jgi:hypothetical protein
MSYECFSFWLWAFGSLGGIVVSLTASAYSLFVLFFFPAEGQRKQRRKVFFLASLRFSSLRLWVKKKS